MRKHASTCANAFRPQKLTAWTYALTTRHAPKGETNSFACEVLTPRHHNNYDARSAYYEADHIQAKIARVDNSDILATTQWAKKGSNIAALLPKLGRSCEALTLTPIDISKELHSMYEKIGRAN